MLDTIFLKQSAQFVLKRVLLVVFLLRIDVLPQRAQVRWSNGE